MYKIICLLSCLLFASCATRSVYISDIHEKRHINSSATHLERVFSDNRSKDVSIGVAVIVGTDIDGTKYVALAPGGLNSASLSSAGSSYIRSLNTEDSKRLLTIIDFSIENYDKKVTSEQSINASFQSHLESKTRIVNGASAVPVITDILTYRFINTGNGADARFNFGDSLYTRRLNKKKLKQLRMLTRKALARIE